MTRQDDAAQADTAAPNDVEWTDAAEQEAAHKLDALLAAVPDAAPLPPTQDLAKQFPLLSRVYVADRREVARKLRQYHAKRTTS